VRRDGPHSDLSTVAVQATFARVRRGTVGESTRHDACHLGGGGCGSHRVGGRRRQHRELRGERRPGAVGVAAVQVEAVQAGGGARFDDVPHRHRRVGCHHRQVRDVALQPAAVLRRGDHPVGHQNHQIRMLGILCAQPQLVEQSGDAAGEGRVSEHRSARSGGLRCRAEQASGHRIQQVPRLRVADAEGAREHPVARLRDARREHRDQAFELGSDLGDHGYHRVDAELQRGGVAPEQRDHGVEVQEHPPTLTPSARPPRRLSTRRALRARWRRRSR